MNKILADLADGTIDIATAERLLDEARKAEEHEDSAKSDAQSRRTDTPPSVKPQKGRNHQGAGRSGSDEARVSVRGVGKRVRIVGDPNVATVSVTGPHVLRRSAGLVEVSSDGEVGPSLEGFSLLNPPRSVDDLRSLGLGKELVVRINPDQLVDAEVTAGSLHATGCPRFGKVRITAGSANLEDVELISDALVQAGQATISGPIGSGRSRVRCESGSLVVKLDEDANVTIRGEVQMGRISWPGGHGSQLDEFEVGAGAGRLDIGVIVGHAIIKQEEE